MSKAIEVRKRKRVRVFFLNCPKLDWQAASYLVLSQNNVQDLFEFEVYSFWVYARAELKNNRRDLVSSFYEMCLASRLPMRKWALRRYAARLERSVAQFLSTPSEPKKMLEALSSALRAHDAWLYGLGPSYGGWSIEPAPTVIVTETPFGGGYGGYYAWGDENDKLAVVTIAHWQRNFAPPSVLEFILQCIQRYCLRMTYPPAVGSHYPTRACIWDFNANLEDVRLGILVGYLCSACSEELSAVISAAELDAIKQFIKNDWIGRTEDLGTVASNLKRIYRYDLDRTRGLSPSFWDLLIQGMTSEAAKWIVPFVLGALVTWFLARFSHGKVPEGPPSIFFH
jgi:hypothetical protein